MGNDEHLHKAFEFFDQNQSGYIEIEELRDSLADEVDGNSEEVINAIIRDVDTDKVSPILLSLVFFLLIFQSSISHLCVMAIKVDSNKYIEAYRICKGLQLFFP